MITNDPISCLLTNLRNALLVSKDTVDVPASRLNGRILEIFKNNGYVEDYRLMKDNAQGTFKVYLKYPNKKASIMGLKRISKPGLRVYTPNRAIPRVLNGLGTAVISTSKGVMDDREARRQRLGGEVLCYVW